MSTFTLRLEESTQNVLEHHAAQIGCEPSDLVISFIERCLIEDGAFQDQPDEKERIQLRLGLVRKAGEYARAIQAHEGTRGDHTVETCRRLEADEEWMRDYRRFLGGADPFAAGIPLKRRINTRLGNRIKSAIGARSVKRPDGRPDVISVSHGIIQSATRLAPAD